MTHGSQIEHERSFHALAARRQLDPGQVYMIDAESGLVSCATIWLHGDVWFIDHFDEEHPSYRREYMAAAMRQSTLWKPRS